MLEKVSAFLSFFIVSHLDSFLQPKKLFKKPEKGGSFGGVIIPQLGGFLTPQFGRHFFISLKFLLQSGLQLLLFCPIFGGQVFG